MSERLENKGNGLKKPDITKPEFFVEICLKGSSDIRKILNIDDDQHEILHYKAIAKARSYFIYSVMDELEKAGTLIMRVEEFIGDTEIDKKDRIGKNIIKSVIEEQYLRVRKMTEILTELILFSTINEDIYYRHYMLVKELKALNNVIGNAKNAYGCHIQNYQKQLEDVTNDIINLENSSVDIEKCWYLALKEKKGKKVRVSGVKGRLSSFEERMNAAFKISDPNQIIALGTSFEEGYGNFSTGIHFDVISNTPQQASTELIKANVAGIGMLAANIIIQSRKLLGDRRLKGYANFLAKILSNSRQAKIALNKRTKPDIKKGDFVNAQGDLAEVTKVMKGKYGFRSFRLKFLLSEDTEIAGAGKMQTVWTHKTPKFEEFPAMWVRKLYSSKEILEGIKREILKHDPNANINTRKITPFMREAVIHLWKNVGLKESVHGKKDQALEKMKEEQERIKNDLKSRRKKTNTQVTV